MKKFSLTRPHRVYWKKKETKALGKGYLNMAMNVVSMLLKVSELVSKLP